MSLAACPCNTIVVDLLDSHGIVDKESFKSLLCFAELGRGAIIS